MWVGGCVTAPTAWASPHWRRGPHRQCDDAGVYTNRWKWPLDVVLGHLCTLLGFARIVRATVGTQECTQIGQNGPSEPFRGICVHCCDASRDTNRDASCARWHERLNRHGVPAAPLAGPSRLVGKTGSERVAPLPGWRLRRGINPHEPPKSQIIWKSPDSPRWFQKMMTATPFGSVAVRTSNAAQPTQGVC